MVPKVSVVIPVYNVEKYLRECLDSVVNQTLKEIQVICIDDGSTDASLEILREYANADSRIRVIRTENSGLSAARNTGAEYAVGQYLYFLDSDDYLRADALELLYKTAESTGVDIVHFGAECIYESEELRNRYEHTENNYRRTELTDQVYDGPTLLKLFQEKHKFCACVYLQFYRAEFYRRVGVRFPEGFIHEDEYFTPVILNKALSATCINENLYIRRYRQSSITTEEDSVHRFNSLFPIFVKLMSEYYLTEKKDTASSEALLGRVKALYWASRRTYESLSEIQRKELLKDHELRYDYLFRDLGLEKKLLEKKEAEQHRKEVQQLRKKVDFLQAEKMRIRRSPTYRIGRFVTFLPRKARSVIRCIKKHGIGYTSKKVFDKLGIAVGKINGKVRRLLGLPAVSVIVPVYNAELYLKLLLDSILNQTFRSFELICVDDGSTDASLEILQEYASRHKNMKVLTQKNQYAGIARNNGMKAARGEYLWFVDADDYAEPDLLQQTYTAAKASNADIVLFVADIFDYHTNRHTPVEWLFDKRYLPKKDPFCASDIPEHIFAITTCVTWNKLIKRSIVHKEGMQYPAFCITEDIDFIYPVIALT